MRTYPINTLNFMAYAFMFMLVLSCSQDSDLLSDYISETAEDVDIIDDGILEAKIENGGFETNEDVAVLLNLNTVSEDKGRRWHRRWRIKKYRRPINAYFFVKKDSLLKFVPNNDFNGEDTLEVTVEVEKSNDRG